MNWLPQIFSRGKRYDDLAVSIQEHLEERMEELMADGMARKQAEQTAHREFGNIALIEQRSREVWHWEKVETLLADLKLVFRRLRKSPGFAVTILLTLAIGIGANTAVFSVVNSVLLKPLPYPDANELTALRLDAPGAGGLSSFSSGLRLSTSMYITFSEHNHSFQSLGIWIPGTANVTGIAQPEQVRLDGISAGVLETLAVPAAVGRWFSDADQDPRGPKSVILNYGYWQRRFGGDRAVIGRSIQVDAQTRTIVGVMPQGFRMVDNDFDLLLPLAIDRHKQKLAGFGFNGIGRLKAGVTLQQADSDLAHLIPVWMDSWSNGPGTNPHYYEIWKISPNFLPLKQQVIGNIGSVLWIVMATVGLVMLIACINVANLLLVRAESRQQEFSIRAALGAGRVRIARELLLESVALGLIGGFFALGVAYAGLRLLVAIGPADLPRLSEISIDARSLFFALLVSAVSGLLFGSVPALKYARSRNALTMSGSSRTSSAGRARQRSRDILVVAQVAMALVLLVSALLMIRTFAALRNVDPGFADATQLETLSIWIPDLLVPDPPAVARAQKQIADNLASIPGVDSVAFAGAVPMDGNDPDWDLITVEGKKYVGGEGPLRLYNYVSPGYFHTMGTRIVAGRDFTWDDLNNVMPAMIVSESFARESWGSAAAAIGKRIKKYDSSPWLEVIGVVEDVHVHGLDEKAPPIVYWPAMFYDRFGREPRMDGLRTVTFVLHSRRTGAQGFLGQIQQAVWSVNPDLPLAGVQTMQQLYSQSMARTSFTLVMLAIAGSMALALGIIGIYGVIAYAVSQRTREIGIRLALGAQKSELKWMFVRSALMLTGIGVVIGISAAALLMQGIKSLLFGISPLDPVTYCAVPLVLATAAACASYLPARRAAGVDPVEALRAD
ncbi:MAG TPA: ABC transporter permease [Terracidiphilus sp.]|jgi:predicted permease|nr:ABC transporter permease [Terracidiphilus sp.]